jgi:hypothetical protein
VKLQVAGIGNCLLRMNTFTTTEQQEDQDYFFHS